MKYSLDDDYEFDFHLLGVSCHEKDYRICWAINHALGINLSKEEKDIEVIIRKSNRFSLHSMYTFFDEDNEVEYRLISNRSTMGYLIPEAMQADYLLMISDNCQWTVDELKKEINGIGFVLTTYQINVESLKSKENLIF